MMESWKRGVFFPQAKEMDSVELQYQHMSIAGFSLEMHEKVFQWAN